MKLLARWRLDTGIPCVNEAVSAGEDVWLCHGGILEASVSLANVKITMTLANHDNKELDI